MRLFHKTPDPNWDGDEPEAAPDRPGTAPVRGVRPASNGTGTAADGAAPNRPGELVMPVDNTLAARYIEARNAWDDWVSTAVAQARTWRRVAFGSMAVAAVAVVGCVVLSGRMTVVPHIVEVDRAGSIVGSYTPGGLRSLASEQVYRSAITRWIVSLRTVTTDRHMQAKLIAQAEAHVRRGDPVYTIVRDMLRARNPYELAARHIVHVEVDEIRRLATSSWYVRWRESETPRGGGTPRRYAYTMTLSTAQGAVAENRMAWNPLGIYVVEMDFTGQGEPAR